MAIEKYYFPNPYAEPLADYDPIIQYTSKVVKSKECVELGLEPSHMINKVSVRNGEISGDMWVKHYTDEEFTVYHEGLKTLLKFGPEVLPKISWDGKKFFHLFDSKMVSSVNPNFKPDTLVQIIRDPEADFKDEDDLTGVYYIEEYDETFEGFVCTHVAKKATNQENRPFTLVSPVRCFKTNELNKYMFKVIDVDFGEIINYLIKEEKK